MSYATPESAAYGPRHEVSVAREQVLTREGCVYNGVRGVEYAAQNNGVDVVKASEEIGMTPLTAVPGEMDVVSPVEVSPTYSSAVAAEVSQLAALRAQQAAQAAQAGLRNAA